VTLLVWVTNVYQKRQLRVFVEQHRLVRRHEAGMGAAYARRPKVVRDQPATGLIIVRRNTRGCHAYGNAVDVPTRGLRWLAEARGTLAMRRP